MCHKMFYKLEQWSGYTKDNSKSQCHYDMCTVGFITKYIIIFTLILHGFIYNFNFEFQINILLLKKW